MFLSLARILHEGGSVLLNICRRFNQLHTIQQSNTRLQLAPKIQILHTISGLVTSAFISVHLWIQVFSCVGPCRGRRTNIPSVVATVFGEDRYCLMVFVPTLMAVFAMGGVPVFSVRTSMAMA